MRRIAREVRGFLLLVLLLGLAVAQSAEMDRRPLVMAIHPYLPSQELRKRYRPLAAYLQAVMNRPDPFLSANSFRRSR